MWSEGLWRVPHGKGLQTASKDQRVQTEDSQSLLYSSKEVNSDTNLRGLEVGPSLAKALVKP